MKCLLCDINPAMREAWEKRAGAAAQAGGAVFGRGWRHYGLAGGCGRVPGEFVRFYARRSGRRLYPRFRGRRGKPVAGNYPYASREGTAGRGSSHRVYRICGHPVADLRADHAQAFRAS